MAVNEFLEFKKQYENTFIRVKFEGQKNLQVMQVRSCIADNEAKPYIVFHNPIVGQTTVRWDDTKQQLDYDFPEVGLFNHKECFYSFHRFPDRQWRKGITSGNTSINDPLVEICRKIPQYYNFIKRKCNVDYHVLTSAFSGSFPSCLDDAIKTINDSARLGIALDSVFGITKSPSADSRFVLWKHLNMIGWVDPTDHSIDVIETIFHQEVLDFLKRKQEFVWTLK